MKNNFQDTFTKFLKQLKAPVTESSALEYLESHPDEGSILAYSEALNFFNIENAAIRIKPEDLITLPIPFIAFSKIHGGTFSVVKNIRDNTIQWFDTQQGWISDHLENFTKTWSGVVLLAETDENSGEKNYTAKRKKEILGKLRVPLAISLMVLIFFYFVLSTPIVNLHTYFLLGLKSIGMVVCTLLFVKSIDNANSLVNKLCNAAGSKISCQSILDSPAAKITPWFSWSDAGFIYFFGSFLAMLLSLSSTTALNSYWSFQVIFSAIAILFSSYSLYYQGIKAKMWCTLCLGVVSIFVLESVLVLNTIIYNHVQWGFNYFLIIGFLIPIIFLLFFKNVGINAIESKNFRKELSKLKSNHEVLLALVGSQKSMPAFISKEIGPIGLGNPNAAHTLLVVTNPLCGWCAKMHARVMAVLTESQNLKCQIIFMVNPKGNDISTRIARIILSLPTSLQNNALNQWFNQNDRNYEKWSEPYLDYPEMEITDVFLNEQANWCNLAEVKQTPTLFFNGKLLPTVLQVEDLIHFTRFQTEYSSIAN